MKAFAILMEKKYMVIIFVLTFLRTNIFLILAFLRIKFVEVEWIAYILPPPRDYEVARRVL